MVLNCAAYLFEGIATQTDNTTTIEKALNGGISLGIPLVGRWFSPVTAEGDLKAATVEERRSARQHTVGAIHMTVLDKLRSDRMIATIPSDRVYSAFGVPEAYVEIQAVLKPTDYFALIGTLKILGPLVAQIFRDFGDKLLESRLNEGFTAADLRGSVNGYESSVTELLDRLEKDYLTGKQIEMVMWSKDGNGDPIGVVDLDVSNYEPAELRAKLSGGKYVVVGKVTREVGQGQMLDLMQKTVLSNTLDLFQRMWALQSDPAATQELRNRLAPVEVAVKKLLRLQLPGPAVRLAAMSVCM